jgi:serine/threonine protein kinase
MSVGTEPVRWQRPRMGGDGATQEWLDGLVSGLCSPDEFLAAMRERFQDDRDGTWEVLSLLDQYYRRGKIKLDLFRALKSRLEDSALGREPNPAPLLPTQASNTVTEPAIPSPQPAISSPQHATADRASMSPQSASDRAAISPQPAAAPPQAATAVPQAAAAVPQAAAAAPQLAVAPQAAPAVSRAPVRTLSIGDVLRGRYRIQGILGHGGMGTVFEAVDEYRLDLLTAGQRLAIKVLHTAVTERQELLSELQREFQNLQLLSHPNVVRVHEFDRDGDLAFFTMELLNGSLLSRVLSARNGVALPRPYALAIMRDVGAAISHAHSRGVVHGDVNPQNIFITRDGELRVLDFGASHTLHRDIWNPDSDLQPHSPVATPGYASCQVLAGQRPDARDDIFAFACVSYVLLSGQHPFPKLTAVQAREQRLRLARPSGLTGHQWRILKQGLRWDRDRRPSDVQQWLSRFGTGAAIPHIPPLAMLVNAPAPRNRKAMLAAATLVILLLGAGGYWVLTNDESPANMLKGWGDRLSALLSTETSPTESAANDQVPPSAPSQPPPGNLAPGNPPRSNPPPSSAAPTARASENAGPKPAPALQASQPTAAPTRIAVAPAAALAAAPAVSAPAPRVEPAPAANPKSAHVEMASDTVEVPPTESTALVIVRRRGSLRGGAAFKWWTESGTAKPTMDFTPASPRVEEIPSGRNSIALSIPVSDRPRTQARSFYVVIDQTESGASLGGRTLTMVTLLPSD